MQIYEICKENRRMLELTIEEFAESIDVDPKLYKKFEDGEFLFSNDIINFNNFLLIVFINSFSLCVFVLIIILTL
jgi:hypothetical protein